LALPCTTTFSGAKPAARAGRRAAGDVDADALLGDTGNGRDLGGEQQLVSA